SGTLQAANSGASCLSWDADPIGRGTCGTSPTGLVLEHDLEKLQTCRIRSCDQANTRAKPRFNLKRFRPSDGSDRREQDRTTDVAARPQSPPPGPSRS